MKPRYPPSCPLTSRLNRSLPLTYYLTRLFFISSTLLWIFLASSANGTVIYVRASGGEVVIAADSKRVFHEPGGMQHSESVCKIHQVEDIVFASAGLVGVTGIALNADISQVARQAMSGNGTLVERVRNFQQLIEVPLLNAMLITRTRDQTEYGGYLQHGALQTVFIRAEKQVPVIALSRFPLTEGPNGTIKLEPKVNLYSGKLTISLGGSPTAIDLGKDEEYWSKGSVDGVRELIKISIADNPSKTGEPIDILKFSKSGTSWIQVKPECKQSKP